MGSLGCKSRLLVIEFSGQVSVFRLAAYALRTVQLFKFLNPDTRNPKPDTFSPKLNTQQTDTVFLIANSRDLHSAPCM